MKDSRTPQNVYNFNHASDGLLSIYSSKKSQAAVPMTPSNSQVYNNQFLGFEQRTKKKVLTYRGMPSPIKSPATHQYPTPQHKAY